MRGPFRLTDTRALWIEKRRSQSAHLAAIEEILLGKRTIVVARGGDFDRWDLQIHGGLVGSIRAMAMVEEHGAGKQLFRLHAWPFIPQLASGLLITLTLLAALAAYDKAWFAAVPLALGALGIAGFVRADCAKAMRNWCDAVNEYAAASDSPVEAPVGKPSD